MRATLEHNQTVKCLEQSAQIKYSRIKDIDRLSTKKIQHIL